MLAGRWWDTSARWLSSAHSVLGAVLLLLVAMLAIYLPAAMAAGIVWRIVPGAVQIVMPEDTHRLISAVSGLPVDLNRALYTRLSGGVALLFGVGLTAALLRRRIPG